MFCFNSTLTVSLLAAIVNEGLTALGIIMTTSKRRSRDDNRTALWGSSRRAGSTTTELGHWRMLEFRFAFVPRYSTEENIFPTCCCYRNTQPLTWAKHRASYEESPSCGPMCLTLFCGSSIRYWGWCHERRPPYIRCMSSPNHNKGLCRVVFKVNRGSIAVQVRYWKGSGTGCEVWHLMESVKYKVGGGCCSL